MIIAALFAAAASALAGSMNSVAILFTEDFHRKVRRDASDGQRLRVMRIASVVSGVVARGCALYMAKIDLRSLLQTWNELCALLGGGFLGTYILGIFRRRTNAVGAIASIGVAVLVKNYTNLYWYGYMPAALFACLIIGYAVSLLTPRRQHGLEGLTMFDMKQAGSSMTGGYA